MEFRSSGQEPGTKAKKYMLVYHSIREVFILRVLGYAFKDQIVVCTTMCKIDIWREVAI